MGSRTGPGEDSAVILKAHRTTQRTDAEAHAAGASLSYWHKGHSY